MTLKTIWSQQLTQELKTKIAEDELYVMALKAVFEETSASNDIAIGVLLSTARRKGFDGRMILQRALNERLGSAMAQPGVRTFADIALNRESVAVAPVQMQSVETGFQCPVCNKEFKSQAALSGHGVNRCKG